MPLNASQLREYKETGYTTVDAFFETREVAALKREVERWIAEGKPRNVSSDPSKENLQLIPLHTQSRLYRALPFHPRVVRAVSDLIGDPVIKILDQMFLKPPHSGMGTNWHTDDAYFKIRDPLRGTAMWIALDDATVDNGTLKVIPGAFREPLPHSRDPDSDHHIRAEVDERLGVHCDLDAGGVVFFCFGTPHATGDNRTSRPRAGVGIHFVNFDFAARDMREGTRWEQVFLTGEQASGGEREYGEAVAGTFAAEMEAVLER